MAHFAIKKGMDIPMEGVAAQETVDIHKADKITVYPSEFSGIKPKCLVSEGDVVKRGSVLFIDKQNEALKFRSPAAGTVEAIVRGARRALDQIVIRVDGDAAEELPSFSADAIKGLTRDEIVSHLLDTGFIALIRQRPFDVIPEPSASPKSIFVNGMATGPLRGDPAILVRGQDSAYLAGLEVLRKLTEGKVHVCTAKGVTGVLADAPGVEHHTFEGPHPAGNASTHIHHIDPIFPHDVVWTIDAPAVAQIGHLFTEGAIPTHKTIMKHNFTL